MESPNEALMRDMASALEHGNLEAFSKFLADDVTYHIPGRNPTSGDYRGGEAVLDLWNRQKQLLGGRMYRVRTYDMAASDEHVIMLAEVTAQRDDVIYTYRTANVYRVVDGKIVEAWPYISDLYAFDAVYS